MSTIVDLGGEWEFRRAPDAPPIPEHVSDAVDEWMHATVPGDVYTDLERAGLIDDPFDEDNELDVQWVGRTDWEYRRTVTISASLLDHAAVKLECLGLDTVATVTVNGSTVIDARNMHRKHTADVGDVLHEGENELRVRFDSPVAYAAARKAASPYEVPLIRYPVDQPGRNFVRKAQCHFGWDWGPCLPGVGIWRTIRLVGHTAPRVEYVTTDQQHDPRDGDVTLDISTGLDVPAESDGEWEVSAVLRAREGGDKLPERDPVAETSREVAVDPGETTAELAIEVADPDLWWPNGYGDQPLYDLTVRIGGTPDGDDFDERTERIGFREFELVREPDAHGESFRFEVNGEPVFAKGANWIPVDNRRGAIEPDAYDDLLESAVAANMNTLRVWGGGIYELDAFYERCDELGILVWQDFMFACALYPADDAFVEEVAAEARYQTRRLSTAPSVALWCGNNENEMSLVSWFSEAEHIDELYADYERLNDTLADVVASEDPGTPFWPASPSSGAGEYDPYDETRGDLHYWDVWHDGEPFEDYLTVEPRFVSEFGYQSFASVDLLSEVVPENHQNPTAPLMEHHQRHPDGNATQLARMADGFRIPDSFESFVYLSQVQHGLAMKTAIEHWRRLKPQCMGTLYWQLNDLWPCASWSSLEYGGDWKAVHHFARRFYAPVLVSVAVAGDTGPDDDPADGQLGEFDVPNELDVWLTSDLTDAESGKLSVEIVTLDGETLHDSSESVTLGAHESRVVRTLEADAELDGVDPTNAMVRVTFDGERTHVENTDFFVPYKRLQLPHSDVQWSVEQGENETDSDDGNPLSPVIEVAAPPDAAALFISLDAGDLPGRFADDYIHLLPGERRRIAFDLPTSRSASADPPTADALRDALSVTHLRETY
ncbi:glycoside hydrolase family 2 protein [Halorubrum gandharaense]